MGGLTRAAQSYGVRGRERESEKEDQKMKKGSPYSIAERPGSAADPGS